MKRFFLPNVLMVCSLLLPSAASSADLKLRFSEVPTEGIIRPLPIGNGYIAGLVHGNPQAEIINLNETSFWSGAPQTHDVEDAGSYFEQIKQMTMDKKYAEVEKLIDDKFFGKPLWQECYEPLGDLHISQYGVEDVVGNYSRTLDMATGVTSVSFKSGGTTFTRETFVSYPDNVMVIRIYADKPGKISLDTWTDSYFRDDVNPSPDSYVMDGQWEGPIPSRGLINQYNGKGLKFRTELKAYPKGGKSSVAKGRTRIIGADEVTLILGAATSHVSYNDISADPIKRVDQTFASLPSSDYNVLLNRHKEKFSEMMGRVDLNVGDPARDNIPVEKRIADVKQGIPDPALEVLSFQFGRYMLVSSSRSGGQPANLQAIWNNRIVPPWGSKYTININIQMNYWPAEVCNLSECHAPLFEMLEETTEPGSKTAKTHYGIDRGWVAHHNLDLWRGTAPVDGARFGMWPVGGAWLCTHIGEHYAFTKDKDFLAKYYPVMKGCAEFLADLLIPYPGTDWLVTPFSMSPEHGFFDSKGNIAYISPGPTMDIAIIRELFGQVINASEVLGKDAKLRKELSGKLAKLPPYRVNHLGFPQEWIEDFDYPVGGHDVSPYYQFFPGSTVKLHDPKDKTMIESYRKWMATRNIGNRGFPSAWNISMWARLGRGDKVAEQIGALSANMAEQFTLQGSGAQVDAPFGFTAGIAESLLQSHEDEIALLPALPDNWKNGNVCGLKARGGYTVNMTWEDGKIKSAEITHPQGGSVKIRNGENVQTIKLKGGMPMRLNF